MIKINGSKVNIKILLPEGVHWMSGCYEVVGEKDGYLVLEYRDGFRTCVEDEIVLQMVDAYGGKVTVIPVSYTRVTYTGDPNKPILSEEVPIDDKSPFVIYHHEGGRVLEFPIS